MLSKKKCHGSRRWICRWHEGKVAHLPSLSDLQQLQLMFRHPRCAGTVKIPEDSFLVLHYPEDRFFGSQLLLLRKASSRPVVMGGSSPEFPVWTSSGQARTDERFVGSIRSPSRWFTGGRSPDASRVRETIIYQQLPVFAGLCMSIYDLAFRSRLNDLAALLCSK